MNYFNQYIKSLFIFVCVFIGLPTLALMSQTPSSTEKPSKPKSLINVLEKSGVFTVFLSAIRQAGLEDKLGKESVANFQKVNGDLGKSFNGLNPEMKLIKF